MIHGFSLSRVLEHRRQEELRVCFEQLARELTQTPARIRRHQACLPRLASTADPAHPDADLAVATGASNSGSELLPDGHAAPAGRTCAALSNGLRARDNDDPTGAVRREPSVLVNAAVAEGHSCCTAHGATVVS